MAGWNNRNCCCEPDAYTCAGGEVNICCMTLQASTWSRALSAYAHNYDPDSICSYVDSPYPFNNACGSVSSLGDCDSVPRFGVFWGVQTDGTVRLCLELYSNLESGSNYVAPVFHCVTGLDINTWYLSPVVFTVSGVTYTITVCSDPHEPFPEWPESAVFLEARQAGALVRSTGNLLCGGTCLVNFPYQLRWSYNIYNDEIKITVFYLASLGGTGGSIRYSGDVLVDYDDGNWASLTHTIPLIAYPIGPDSSVVVLPVDSCDIPPPPPPPPLCEWETACWPDLCPCLVAGSEDPPVLYRTIYADVSGAVTATGLALDPNNTTLIFSYNSGSDYIVIQCTNGGMDPYYVAAQFSGVTYFFSIPANGLACTEDGSQMVDETVTNGTVTIRFYTL